MLIKTLSDDPMLKARHQYPFLSERELTAARQAVFGQLRERSVKRATDYDVRVVNDFSDMYRVWLEPTILGSYTHTYLGRSDRREIRLETQNGICAVDMGDGVWDSPTTLSRDYIKETFPRYRNKCNKKNGQADLLRGARMPQYAHPCTFEQGYYVDIKSAWWAAQLRIGWNVDYWPGRFLFPGLSPFDFPFHESRYKVARSALVTIARDCHLNIFHPALPPTEHTATFLQGKKPPLEMSRKGGSQFRFNAILNWNIYAIIADVLQSIAHEARQRLGDRLIYWNTDGAIVTDAAARDGLIELIADWGFQSSIKGAGPGLVRGSGTYIVGEMWSDRLIVRPNESDSMTGGTLGAVTAEWLKPRWVAILRGRGWKLGINGEGAI